MRPPRTNHSARPLRVLASMVSAAETGVRLHEEVLYAGGWAPEQGRRRTVATYGRATSGTFSGVATSSRMSLPKFVRWMPSPARLSSCSVMEDTA